MEAMLVDSSHDLTVFAWCFVCGIGIGLLLDIFRGWRKAHRVSPFLLTVQDVALCALSVAMFYQTLVYANCGQLRWYEFVSLFFGITLYLLTASKYVIKPMTAIFSLLYRTVFYFRSISAKICKLIFRPFTRLYAFVFAKSEAFRQKCIKKKCENKEKN